MPKIFEIAVYGAEGNARLHRSQRREPRRGEVVALRTGQRHASAVPRRRLPRNTSATQSFVGHSPHRFPSRAPCMRLLPGGDVPFAEVSLTRPCDARLSLRSDERRVGKEGVSTCRSGWLAVL